MGVRTGPVAASAQAHRAAQPTIRAVFTRPGLRSVTGSAQKHEILGARLGIRGLPADLIRDPVVHLEVPGAGPQAAYLALLSGRCNQGELQGSRQGGSPVPAGERCTSGGCKAVGSDATAVAAGNAEGLDRDAAFPHVSCSPRRMVVPVLVAEFLRRDIAVGEDMLKNGSRTFGAHRTDPSKQPIRDLPQRGSRRADMSRSRSAGSTPRAAASFASVRRVMLRSPRSMAPTYVRWRPHCSARPSCERPLAARSRRMLLAAMRRRSYRMTHRCHSCYVLVYRLNIAATGIKPTLLADHIMDRNGHVLPYVRFQGGRLALTEEALQVLAGESRRSRE